MSDRQKYAFMNPSEISENEKRIRDREKDIKSWDAGLDVCWSWILMRLALEAHGDSDESSERGR